MGFPLKAESSALPPCWPGTSLPEKEVGEDLVGCRSSQPRSSACGRGVEATYLPSVDVLESPAHSAGLRFKLLGSR